MNKRPGTSRQALEARSDFLEARKLGWYGVLDRLTLTRAPCRVVRTDGTTTTCRVLRRDLFRVSVYWPHPETGEPCHKTTAIGKFARANPEHFAQPALQDREQ